MSTWTVPLSSSPQAPSTPGPGRPQSNPFPNSPNGFTKIPFAPNPSTTPAGPPPSSVGSFTPADPPPSSVYGSSQLGSGKTLFKSKGSTAATNAARRSFNPISSGSIDKKRLARFSDSHGTVDFGAAAKAPARNGFGVPSSSPPRGPTSGEDEDSYEDKFEAPDEEPDTEGYMDEDASNMGPVFEDYLLDLESTVSSPRKESIAKGKSVEFYSSVMDSTPRGVKRSRGGSRIFQASPRGATELSKSRSQSAIPNIIKSMGTQLAIAELQEKDNFIVRTETIIQQDLYGNEVIGGRGPGPKSDLSTASEQLSNFWRSYCEEDTATNAIEHESLKGIGPNGTAAPVQKANFLSSLLLRLRHPPTAKGKQALAVGGLNRSTIDSSASETDYTPSNPTAIPKVLVDWMNDNHNPYDSIMLGLQRFSPNPTANSDYWDILFSLTLRGKLFDVIRLLKESDFHHARTAREDRKDSSGYSSVQVRNIERVVNRAIQVLERSPSLQDDDWNITGNEWYMFRKRIEHAINDLNTFAEGRDRDNDLDEPSFEASNFGLRSTKKGLSQSARKAESQVPWTVYQNLKTMYGILLGGSTEILAMAGDWVEATIALTIWWSGDDDEDMAVGNVALTRRSLIGTKSRGARLVDVNDNAAYLRRLASAFEHVYNGNLDDNGLSVNTLNPVEVGLASIFEGNVEGVLGLLRAWSLPIASAIAEVASEGGWLDLSARMGVVNDLDESDLMLLSGRVSAEQPLTRDAILVQYADALSYRASISWGEDQLVQEGWELSISVLTRLDDEGLAIKKINELLHRLPADSDIRVDKIMHTCERFGIMDEARTIAEGYADSVIEKTDDYGRALIYFARAHCQKKVKDVLDLLISLSLVQSVAYPAIEALDSNLYALIFTPERSLGQLSLLDTKAVEMLHTYMTGYGALRRFYDLRDEGVHLEEGQKPSMRPIARNNAAATALVSVINSAADNIHGGLYDEDRGAVVQVDGLLALLGEAMMFINQPSAFLLSLPQSLAILKAIEDLQTVTPRVYNQCEECFHSTIRAYQGQAVPVPPRELLKKTMNSMTSSHSFSMIGSSMVESDSNGTGGSSNALVQSKERVKRGWDWRKGLAKDAKGEDVLRMLRLGLAKDIAKHWVAGEGA